MALLRSAKARASIRSKPGIELLVLALSGKANSGNFDKVIKLIDDLVSLLAKEQTDDDSKKEYCASEFDESDDRKKLLERTVAGEEASIASTEESISTLSQEIAALEAGIKALDKSVADATAQRK